MKNLLIATAALSLMGGAAFAQNSTMTNPQSNTPSTEVTAGASQGGQAAAGNPAANADGSAASAPSSPAAPPAGSMPSDSSMGAAPAATSDSTATTPPADTSSSTAMASAAPESYPVCTSKHEDHCVNRSQATRTAMVRHHAKSSQTAPADTQPSGL